MGLAESDKVIVAIPHRVSAATWHIANTQMLEAVAGKTIYVDVNTREGGCDMDQLDGSYITISPGAKSCINVMEIRPVVSPIAEYLDEQDSYEQRSWLTQKASQLLTFFHILIPDLTNEEEQLVDEAIIKTYNEFGITHKNDSVYIPGTKTLKTMPKSELCYESLESYELPPRTQFSMLNKPAVSIKHREMTFNMACIRLFEGVQFILPFTSRTRRRLAVATCSEEEAESVQWARINNKGAWANRTIVSEEYLHKVFEFMHWDPNCRYKVTLRFWFTLEHGQSLSGFAYNVSQSVDFQNFNQGDWT